MRSSRASTSGLGTQDSGNRCYGVVIEGERYFVKTAGPPDDTRWYLAHSQRVALLRNALERRGELALLRALGFGRGRLGLIVVAEDALLLVLGLAAGTVAALPAVAPR